MCLKWISLFSISRSFLLYNEIYSERGFPVSGLWETPLFSSIFARALVFRNAWRTTKPEGLFVVCCVCSRKIVKSVSLNDMITESLTSVDSSTWPPNWRNFGGFCPPELKKSGFVIKNNLSRFLLFYPWWRQTENHHNLVRPRLIGLWNTLSNYLFPITTPIAVWRNLLLISMQMLNSWVVNPSRCEQYVIENRTEVSSCESEMTVCKFL